MMNQLDAVEKRLRDLFESRASVLSRSDQFASLIHHLCESLQNYFIEAGSHERLGNPSFVIKLNPVTLKLWKSKADWQPTLTDIITSTAGEFNLHFTSPPRYSLTARNSLAEGEVMISIVEPSVIRGRTSAIPINNMRGTDTEDQETPCTSYLILQGDRIIPLRQSVINIGRKSSNQIVINDMRISRTHAQIRRVHGNFLIFDVGSTGGTFVNSERIDQYTLRPGDVISLAGYPIIFTEDRSLDGLSPKGKTSEIKANHKREVN